MPAPLVLTLLLSAPSSWATTEPALLDIAKSCGARFEARLQGKGVELPVQLSVRKFLNRAGKVDILDFSKKVKASFGAREGFETVGAGESGAYRLEGILKKEKLGYTLKLRLVETASGKPVAGCASTAKLGKESKPNTSCMPSWASLGVCRAHGYVYASALASANPSAQKLATESLPSAQGAQVIGVKSCDEQVFALARGPRAPAPDLPECNAALLQGIPMPKDPGPVEKPKPAHNLPESWGEAPLDFRSVLAFDKKEEVSNGDKIQAYKAFVLMITPQLKYAEQAAERWFDRSDLGEEAQAPSGELDFEQLKTEEANPEVKPQQMAIKWELFAGILDRQLKQANKRIMALKP